MATVYEHLEAFSGKMLRGWSVNADGESMPFQVVQMSGGPYAGTVMFATLGLSNFPLPNGKVGDKARMIRHELLIVVPDDAIPSNIAGIIQQAGLEAISRNAAYLCGEMLGPKGHIFEGYEPKALYASNPVHFPEGFWSVKADGVGDVALVWLVPMLDSEVQYLQANGWPLFEKKWEMDDPDLVDYRRTS